MTPSEIIGKIRQQFPLSVVLEPSPIKGVVCVKVSKSADYAGLLRMLKENLGFNCLDFITAIDWKGPVDARGYIVQPNPNAFLAEGAVLSIMQEPLSPGFPYKEVFEIVVMVSNWSEALRLAVRFEIPRSSPLVPSLTGLWKAADWQERELYDLFGVVFEGHPRLKKILTPEFIKGYPLRKDYVHVKDQYD